MKTMTKWWWYLALALVLSACGTATDTKEPEQGEDASTTLNTDLDDSKADAPGTWSVKTDGLTLWVDTSLEPTFGNKQTLWVLRGRVSKSMSELRAYDVDGDVLHGAMVSARKFELLLTPDEVLEMISGGRIYLDFVPREGRTPLYHGMVQFAPRFADWAGTSAIFVFRAVNPVIVGDELIFRGRAKTKDGYELELVYTDDDAGPALYDDEPGEYHFDWTSDALMLAADPPDDPVWFRASDSASRPVQKTASLQMRLVQMGVGTDSPLLAWPRAECTAEVRTCLDGLSSPDTSTCGWAYEVSPCLADVVLPLAADPARFVADLELTISRWYEQHEADVRAANGRTLDAALQAIDVQNVGKLIAAEVDMFGYDPAHFDVFYHVDPVFPGSDRIWYGVYDRAGTLIGMQDVN